MTDKVYNHTEMTEITQYNVEGIEGVTEGKRYVPVFHGLQPKPRGVTELHEGYVEIGGPSDTPWDTEDYDDLILAQSGLERDIHPDNITVYPSSIEVKFMQPEESGYATLSATVSPASSEFPITWEYDDTKVIIEETLTPGVIKVKPKAVTASTTIKAKSGAVESNPISAEVKKIAVTGVALNKSTVTLAPEGTETLTATVAPSGAYVQTVTRNSSDENVATVEGGVVTAVADGSEVATATITATSTDDNTKTATCTVTVKIAVTGVELNEGAISLAPNATQQLTATVTPDSATVSTVSRSSSDETIATVEDGLVTAVADGEAIITATSTDDATKTATCTVTVETPVNP